MAPLPSSMTMTAVAGTPCSASAQLMKRSTMAMTDGDCAVPTLSPTITKLTLKVVGV